MNKVWGFILLLLKLSLKFRHSVDCNCECYSYMPELLGCGGRPSFLAVMLRLNGLVLGSVNE